MNKGRLLYEKYRRHEPDAERWDWLDQEVREFWDRLARIIETDVRIAA